MERIKSWIRRVLRVDDPEGASGAEHRDRSPESDDENPDETGQFIDVPTRDTVQLLPGRLAPLIPEVIQQEVRFQKSGSREQEITLGWELGEPPHHVTLDHPSIQPLHAKMTFQNGSWMIESLAPHDPVEVNGTPVPSTSGPYLLAHGDQIRIGEALFRFHLP